MGLPNQTVFLLQEIELGRGAVGVIHLAVGREIFDERQRPRWLPVSIVNRTMEQKQIMTSEIGVRLFAGDEQEVAVGEPLAALEIDLLFVQAKLARVGRMRVRVEVGQDRDVDAEITEDG